MGTKIPKPPPDFRIAECPMPAHNIEIGMLLIGFLIFSPVIAPLLIVMALAWCIGWCVRKVA